MANLPALQPVQIQPLDIPNALAAHYKLQEMQQQQDSRNALMQAGPGLVSNDPTQFQNSLSQIAGVDPQTALQLQASHAQQQKAAQDLQWDQLSKAGQVYGAISQLPDDQIVSGAQQALAIAKSHGADTSQIEPIVASGDPNKIRQFATLAAKVSMSRAQQLSQSNADRSFQAGRSDHADTLNYQNRSLAIQQQNANTNAQKAVAPPIDANPEIDPASRDILSQTGLSMNGFMYLTGQVSKLSRDAATRNAAAAEAKAFAKRSGTDVSTLASQYKAYNDTLHSNVLRNNQMQILDGELTGTISNLKPVADAASLGALKVANVAKLFAGEQVTDPTVQQYSFYLKQLQSEVAGYLAAARGNLSENGSVKTDDSDMRDAADIIKNGLNSRQADGLQQAIQSTQEKAKGVLSTAIHSANKQVWGLFGLGQNYDKLHPIPGQQPQSNGGNVIRYDANGNRIQ